MKLLSLLFLSTGLDCLSRHMYRIVNMQQQLKFFSQDKSFEWGLHFFLHTPTDPQTYRTTKQMAAEKNIYTLAAYPGKGRGAHTQIFRPSWALKGVENRFESSFKLLTP